jgi:hypothetical protein
MGKILEIDEDRVKAVAKKCPEWKAGLKELFPGAFPQNKFLCGTVFTRELDKTVWQLRHAPGNKQYCLTDVFSGYNMLKHGGLLIFSRNPPSKEIEVPVEDLGLKVVKQPFWSEVICRILKTEGILQD